MIKGISAEALLADRGYDTDAIIACALNEGMEAVTPSKRNRKEQRVYDVYLYKLRHLVENAFLILKRWRSIATRYAKPQGLSLRLFRFVVLPSGLRF